MSHTRWDERDRWRIPHEQGDSSMHWYEAPGVVRMEAISSENSELGSHRAPFWCIGTFDGRWWANEDAQPELHWFGSEQEAMDFVEVMIRMS